MNEKTITRYDDPSNDPRLEGRCGGKRDFFHSFAVCARGEWLTLAGVFRLAPDTILPIQWICEAAYLEGRDDERAAKDARIAELEEANRDAVYLAATVQERADALRTAIDAKAAEWEERASEERADGMLTSAGIYEQFAAELRALLEVKP